MCLVVHACDLGTGGAVELSWSLRPESGAGSDKFVDCARSVDQVQVRAITRVRLHWQVGSATCSRAWNCGDNHGATRFEVPQGTANLTLTLECGLPTPGLAECEDDQPADPATYIAPATVRRDAIRGEVVTLGAVELVVSDAACPSQPCTCPMGAQVATDHTSR
ncbi:MAG TPA: hypothetical protein VHT91_43795 [Kofleriaceae bacterium]|nr:hypothetical protein [Kofleriaceae bacterium]